MVKKKGKKQGMDVDEAYNYGECSTPALGIESRSTEALVLKEKAIKHFSFKEVQVCNF